MAIEVPADYDVNAVTLDVYETYFRDILRLDIANWAKFRHTIYIGNNSACLHPRSGIVAEAVKEAYRELGKSHYEVIRSLGWAKQSLLFANGTMTDDPVMRAKSENDFYFYVGRLLDNLARLIYIVNDPHSASDTRRFRGQDIFVRHWLGWGDFSDPEKYQYPGYVRIKHSRQLQGIKNIRNVLTHGWAVPIQVDQRGKTYWPKAIRSKRNFLWWYDERDRLKKSYRKWTLIERMMREDFAFIEKFQSLVFHRLTRDIKSFEDHYGLEICVPANSDNKD